MSGATPMQQCTRPNGCNNGCEETLPCECVIYKGRVLTTLDVIDGESLCSILGKIDTLVFKIKNNNTFNSFTYRLPCVTSLTSNLNVFSIKKNGSVILATPTSYTVSGFLTYLQTLDPAFTLFNTNTYQINSSDFWEMSIDCADL